MLTVIFAVVQVVNLSLPALCEQQTNQIVPGDYTSRHTQNVKWKGHSMGLWVRLVSLHFSSYLAARSWIIQRHHYHHSPLGGKCLLSMCCTLYPLSENDRFVGGPVALGAEAPSFHSTHTLKFQTLVTKEYCLYFIHIQYSYRPKHYSKLCGITTNISRIESN